MTKPRDSQVPDERSFLDRCPMVTRRRFLLGLGATVVTAACSGKSVTVFQQSSTTTSLPAATGSATTLPAGTFVAPARRTLVVVELGGGNDGFSMVVPHQDSRYHDLRRSTRLTDVIDLDGEIGLHPALTSTAVRYQAGSVAVVEGVGTPKPDLSHFLSMQRWWQGSDAASHTGWLGRYLDATAGYEELLAGITIGPGPSQAMLGDASFVVNIADSNGLATEMPWWIDEPDELLGAWAGFAPVDVPLAELTPLQRAIGSTVTAQRQLQAGLAPLREAIEQEESDEDEEAGYLARQLDLAAGLITSGVRPRVVYVQGEGDFDTHEDQKDRHGELMTELDSGLAAFWGRLEQAGVADQALVMTASEFGRRPEDNDGGTDHGTASSHFVMGPGVQGGRYGEAPSLSRLDEEGNPVHTVDYRSIYATVLDGWLGANHPDLLDASYETLPLLRG